MANIPPVGEWIAPHTHRVKWAGMTSDDIGLGASDVNLAYKTINVTGSFVGGGTTAVQIQGSNATDRTTATDWVELNDANGAALLFTADRMERMAENPRWIRPRFSVSTGGVVVDVIMVSTRA